MAIKNFASPYFIEKNDNGGYNGRIGMSTFSVLNDSELVTFLTTDSHAILYVTAQTVDDTKAAFGIA